MDDKTNYSFALITIVAIVAIVGLVVLFAGRSQTTGTAEQEMSGAASSMMMLQCPDTCWNKFIADVAVCEAKPPEEIRECMIEAITEFGECCEPKSAVGHP